MLRGVAVNLAGFALILAPWTVLSDASGNGAVALGAASWIAGGLLAAIGLGMAFAPAVSWSRFLKQNGLVLAVLVGVGLVLPEAADALHPLWNVQAVTEVNFAMVVSVFKAMGCVIQSIVADKVIVAGEFLVAVGAE